uniref:Cytochrome P450 monooxygenase CYP6CY49 n=3 Tax=Aphis gossypii TaxID=80765 RepID=A0A6H0JNL8_APHGO|nr:cytochrome P450 monooxygenase CYP6CY49 [Aphis gossypii]
MISYLINCLFDPIILCLIIINCTFLYYYLTSTYDKWSKLNVLHVEPIPLFGNVFKMMVGLERQVQLFDRIYHRFPEAKICGFYQMRIPYLMIRDPVLINTILIKDFSHFVDHGIDIDESVNIMGRSLFLTNGQKWKIMRQKLSPGFTSVKLRGTHEQIQKCTDQLLNYIDENSKQKTDGTEVNKIIKNLTIDVIGTCAFGMKLDTINSENNVNFKKYVNKLIKPNGKLLFFQYLLGTLFPKVIKLLKIQTIDVDATNFFRSVFREVIDYRTEHNVDRNDIAQTLMKARNDLVLNNESTGGENYCELDIIANAMLFFAAGTETVAATASYCLYELAINTDIQDRLRAEITSSKIKHGAQININNEFLEDLHYAEMVINETLRKYTLFATLMRKSTQNYDVPGESLTIEKGQKITIPLYSIHHDPKYYPNPDTFDPERFTEEEKSKRPNGTFLPFGDGPRHCIGKRLAELELKLIISKILSNFEILPCEKTEIPLTFKTERGMITSKNGVWLSFKTIKN